MRVLERASTLVPSCSVRHLRTVQFSYASQYDSVSLGTVELVPGFVCFAVRLGGVVGHRGAGAWFWHLVPLLLKVLLHNRAYHAGGSVGVAACRRPEGTFLRRAGSCGAVPRRGS